MVFFVFLFCFAYHGECFNEASNLHITIFDQTNQIVQSSQSGSSENDGPNFNFHEFWMMGST